MNCKTQVVLAAGTGYLLGRQRKLRWGLLLVAAAATGRLSRPGGLLDHGARALKATPELGKLGELGAPLVAATKDAARAAVSGRIGSITDRLRGGGDEADEEREPQRARRGGPRDGGEEPDEEREPQRARRGGPRDGDEEPDEEREPRVRRQRAVNRRQRSAAEEAPDEPDDAYEDEGEEDDDNLATAGAGRSHGRPPVRRRRGD